MKFIGSSLVTFMCAAALVAVSTPSQAADNDNNQRQNKSTRNPTSSGSFERLSRLTGSQVMTSDREKVGKLNNLVVDLESGRVLFAIVGLDDGNDRVAVPPGVFSDTRGGSAYLKINKDKLNNAPKLEGEVTRERVSQASFAHRVYQHFNQQMWWQGNTSADQGSFNNVQAGGQLIGMDVVNVQDQPVGKVNNALIDLPAGRIVYVVLSPAGNMNMDNKLFAFPPSALTLHKSGNKLTTDTDRQKLVSGPSFEKDQWPSPGDRSFASRVYEHYGKQAYFLRGSSGLSATGGDSERTYENNSNKGWDDDSSSSQNNNQRSEDDIDQPLRNSSDN